MDKKKKVLQLHKRFCDGMGDFFTSVFLLFSLLLYFLKWILILQKRDQITLVLRRKEN